MTEFQFHDFAHLKRTAGSEPEAFRHNLYDNVHVLLPGATHEQVLRLQDALEKKFKPKETAGDEPGMRAYRIGRNGNWGYCQPPSEIPAEKQSIWDWVTANLVGKLKLPERTPYFIYGGSSHDAKQHAANLLKAIDVIHKLGIEALVYRNDVQGGNHVWHVKPAGGKKAATAKVKRRQ